MTGSEHRCGSDGWMGKTMAAQNNAQIKIVHVHAIRHRWVRHLLKDFETNPKTQYKVHIFFTYFWLANIALSLFVFIFAQGFWQRASGLYLVIVSLYANFATDYGAVSAAEAAGIGTDGDKNGNN